jgi:HD-GYP domain-containing protein (c-di-GMP phosphodiesterase class II)/phosphoribosyl 1,2-cyclic phosphodiesterase
MEIRIWGVRGSVPTSSPGTLRYGGNTTCIEIRTNAGERIILDAGTGICALGKAMMLEEPGECTILLSHWHWDHIQGLPFFAPLFNPHWQLTINCPVTQGNVSAQDALNHIFDGRHFPLKFGDIARPPELLRFTPGDFFQLGSARVETCPTNHPGSCAAFRITADGWSFAFTSDHENHDAQQLPDSPLHALLADCDCVLADGQFTAEEYPRHRCWGHAAMDSWPPLLAALGVRRLLITHHSPGRTDLELDACRGTLLHRFATLPLDIEFAQEGMVIHKERIQTPEVSYSQNGCWLCDFGRNVALYNDVGMILDNVLHEARRIAAADAGTVYLVENGMLHFAHTQNATLFPGSAVNKHLYARASMPVDTKSIAGYAASTKQALNLEDAHMLPPDVPFSFNPSFDAATGYHTGSILTLPLIDRNGNVQGVLQLINSLQGGKIVPFDREILPSLERLAQIATEAVERGLMANELILRMVRIAALRDPRETASHVQRVGAYAAELYHRWAERREVDIGALKHTKDRLRLAAMLHDIGKVGIEDAVLKKPARLDPAERAIMEQHCALGAKLFVSLSMDVDAVAREVALHHHQKWDGTGYTGSEEFPCLDGENIPLAARIVAVADVYDALVSRRCYKDAWDADKALHVIKEDAGSHFDPEIVECFLEIQDIIAAIRNRYPDTDP